jgi:predicted RNase H-like HicB family nuclease
MKFKVALYPSEEGFSVSVPSLPCCWSQGATEDEALTNIADAIREYLQAENEVEEGAVIRAVEVSAQSCRPSAKGQLSGHSH